MVVNKVCLFGASGMLGNYMKSYFAAHSKLTLVVAEFRISEASLHSIYDVLLSYGVDENTCVINCIGLIPQRKPELERDYYIINTLFPHLLFNACDRLNAKMIQPSTDCVFDGSIGNYTEASPHSENTAYGMSKSLGEPLGATVLRTSIIGEEAVNKKSFLEWVLSNHTVMNGWTNHMWNGLTCLHVCKIIDRIICEDLFWKGVRHFYSPTAKSKFELAVMIHEIYGTTTHVRPLNTERVDKTLRSNYALCVEFNIPELYVQLKEQKEFHLQK
jgi:dTDP-4-dehydrorhamnose reductase